MPEINFEEIAELIKKGQRAKARKLVSEVSINEAAKIINDLPRLDKFWFFSILGPKKGADVILELNDEAREELIELLSGKKLARVASEMNSDDATDFLEELPDEKSEMVLETMDEEGAEEVKKLMSYPPESAGGLMQKEYIAVLESDKIKDAVRKIKRDVEKAGDLHNIFVVDTTNVLVGILPVRKLILFPTETEISKIMDKDLISVMASKDQEEVAKIFKEHDLISIPVINEELHLVGKITVDDIVEVIEEESSEDLFRILGLGGEVKVSDSVGSMVRKRAPWLVLNLVTAFLGAAIVALFQDTIQSFVFLAVFLPVVAAIGGTSGNQTVAIIVRALALDEIDFKNVRKVLFRQVMTGLINGVLVGFITGIVAFYFWSNFKLGLVIMVAMIGNIAISGLLGGLVPLTLRRLNVDPALASSQFITMFTDSLGFLFLLGLAAAIF
ncbi:MAG: magnesium transporter [Candidatus Diapherotrites archaeon]